MTPEASPGIRPAPLLGLLALAALAMTAISMAIGYAPLALGQAVTDLLAGEKSLPALVLYELRLPRALLGALVGFSLGMAGAAMQGLLRNPLAEPGVIGISSAAAFGAVLAFYSGLSASLALALPLGGIAGALVATVILFILLGRGASTTTLILAGVALNSFAGAATALALNLAPNPYAALEIVFWLMGSLADRSFTHVWLAAPLILAGMALLLTLGRGLDAMTLGEDAAESLGFRPARMRLVLILGTAAAVGASVAVAGAIGFVGLVVPHILRPLVGARPSRLLPAAALGGAAVLLAADVATRLIAPERDLKLGVLTALVGAPFFLHLIWSMRRVEA